MVTIEGPHGSAASALSASDLELLRKQFSASPKNRVAQNAVAQTSVDEVALDREIVVGTDTTVSNHSTTGVSQIRRTVVAAGCSRA